MTTTTTVGTCPVCLGSQFHPPPYCDRLLSCQVCGLLRRPEQDHLKLDETFYEAQQFTSIDPDWIEGRRLVFADEIRRLQAFRQTGRLLDVGAGHGFFLSACRDAGWDCEGLEIGQHAAAFARDHFGLNVRQSPIETAALPDGAFDVITFWNVLDQLPDPRAALLASVRALRPGGLLLARCPNGAFHLRVRQLARRLAPVLPLAKRLDRLTVFHLFSFSPPALRRLLSDVGFEPIQIDAAPLSWTRGAGDRIGISTRLLRGAIFGAARALQTLSGGRVQYCPSVMARAIKRED